MIVTPELLLQAYQAGVFPMAERRDDPEIFWVDPRQRGVLPIGKFHLSRSLARRLRHDDYAVTRNRDFGGVVVGCADRDETWISAEISALYEELHKRGHAHSLEVWEGAKLIGGVYGVAIGAAFFGESMFSRARDASKVALAWLCAHLNQSGYVLFDTQFITPHLASLGAIEVPRAQYHAQLQRALRQPASFTEFPLPSNGQEVVQRITQTSYLG